MWNIRFLDPLLLGDYPLSMKRLVRERLPQISQAISKLLVGSLDFVGINHYTTLYARNDRTRIRKFILQDATSDAAVITTPYRGGVAIVERAASCWLRIVPWGIRKLTRNVKEKYGKPPVIITENGKTTAIITGILSGHCLTTGNGTWATQSDLDSTTWITKTTPLGFQKILFIGSEDYLDRKAI
ncbi:Glycoside hydrolase [Trema orientale]|uniref:Glycoside hydrolase n=1 Tax=Trema orientale TaxID=63057 RepID=A0A2P5B0K9_TREOI|nr:Glycoside hydrolase [Trema orientale]